VLYSLEPFSAHIYKLNDLLVLFWVTFLSFGPVILNDTIATVVLSLLSGAAVGFSLGLIGGGGSILAVPLLIYVVGLTNTHVAIGTSALAVGTNALINMIHHRRKGHVRVNEGVLFAIPGALGTIIGAQLGLLTPSEDLLVLFAVFMMALSLMMLLRRDTVSAKNKDPLSYLKSKGLEQDETAPNSTGRFEDGISDKDLHHPNIEARKKVLKSISQIKKYYRILLVGFGVGVGAGYFGIGGGFIIVPALMHTISGLTITDAVGTSLISVSTFGFLTATRYSLSGEINWLISLLFIGGGILGGIFGTRMSSKVSKEKLKMVFAIILIAVAVYIILKSLLNV
jgi:uncharacterized protein